MTKADMDNHANQMNPNNDAYWQSRGLDHRPDEEEEPHNDKGDQPKKQQEPPGKNK